MAVLIVDDEPMLCRAVVRSGIATHIATSLDEGLRVARELQPEVVLLDTRFRGDPRTGIDVLPELRAACPRVRVCVLSAFQAPGERERALELGACLAAEKTSLDGLRRCVAIAFRLAC